MGIFLCYCIYKTFTRLERICTFSNWKKLRRQNANMLSWKYSHARLCSAMHVNLLSVSSLMGIFSGL